MTQNTGAEFVMVEDEPIIDVPEERVGVTETKTETEEATAEEKKSVSNEDITETVAEEETKVEEKTKARIPAEADKAARPEEEEEEEEEASSERAPPRSFERTTATKLKAAWDATRNARAAVSTWLPPRDVTIAFALGLTLALALVALFTANRSTTRVPAAVSPAPAPAPAQQQPHVPQHRDVVADALLDAARARHAFRRKLAWETQKKWVARQRHRHYSQENLALTLSVVDRLQHRLLAPRVLSERWFPVGHFVEDVAALFDESPHHYYRRERGRGPRREARHAARRQCDEGEQDRHEVNRGTGHHQHHHHKGGHGHRGENRRRDHHHGGAKKMRRHQEARKRDGGARGQRANEKKQTPDDAARHFEPPAPEPPTSKQQQHPPEKTTPPPPPPPPPEQAMEKSQRDLLRQMSIKQLQNYLRKHDITCRHCVEKDELVERVLRFHKSSTFGVGA